MSTHCNMAIDILQVTDDGDNLDPYHLWILQAAVNGHLTDEGESLFSEIHAQCTSGEYCKRREVAG